MINVIIVGGDVLGNIRMNLWKKGYICVKHITGRSPGDLRVVRNMNAGSEMLIVFTDFISHMLAREIKRVGKENGAKMVFCKRSWSSLVRKI